MSTYSISAPSGWVEKRLAVGVAILIAYFVNYVILALSLKETTEVKDYLNRRLYLFSIAGLLSMTFIQASSFQSVLAWLTLVPLVLLHLTAFKSGFDGIKGQKNNIWVVYYFLQFIWFFGIIIQFYMK